MSSSQPDTSLLTALQGRLHDPDSLLINTASHDEYFHDATGYSVKPHGILIAASVDDLTSAVTFCHEHHIPITTRGAGTGLSGGCVASPGALVISVEKLTDLTVDPNRRIAICGPGVITKTLQDAAAEHGLTYPPDPASYAESTLGGNIAENAGGLRCVKYGVTRDYVLGLEAVTAAGETIGTGYFNDYRGLNVGDVLI
ncbi:FAD-binding protein, partial [candidate division GN15 bacterium]|nr:FAD-binding protein [candidate division GN15 bacterium]